LAIRKNPLVDAYSKIVKLVKVRDRSIREVKDYLLSWGISDELIPGFIDKLKEDHLLDDDRFAENRVFSRAFRKYWGKKKIQSELLIFGIDQEVIDRELIKISKNQWLENALHLIQKNKTRTYTTTNDVRKLHYKLQSAGYEEDTILAVMKHYNLSDFQD
jgi:regulatory protein